IQLLQPGLVQQVAGILDTTQLPSHCLKLEITESSLMAKAQDAIGLLEELRNLGIQLSLDDFGIGYSSLSRLQHLPVNGLKIDQSFVRELSQAENQNIIASILTLAHRLGMIVTAEGIETPEQWHYLEQLGCHFGQGFYFSKPVDAATAEQLLLRPR
ncbi:MAG: EAL domain-containing protein, partial [Kamptonema sp. SIO4C4]|nr:EAL domain-containing protein [Kamptonema sp. SIO4C4]